MNLMIFVVALKSLPDFVAAIVGRIQRMGDVEKETKKGETRFAF
jgi:hypothetical protein